MNLLARLLIASSALLTYERTLLTPERCRRGRLPGPVAAALLAAQDAGAQCSVMAWPCEEGGGAHANVFRAPASTWPRLLAAGFRSDPHSPGAWHYCEGEARGADAAPRLAGLERSALAFLAYAQDHPLPRDEPARLEYLVGVVAGVRAAREALASGAESADAATASAPPDDTAP